MQRRKLLQGFAALAIAERIAGLKAAWAAGTHALEPGLRRASGEVFINGKPAQEGMAVQAGDSIRTGPGSSAIYVVGRDAFLQRSDSTVSLAGDALKKGLRILSGKLLSVFGKGELRIETATATIGIRGTGCYIESEADRVYFCLCYGKAEVQALAAPEQIETIETRHHDHPIYIQRDGGRMMVPADVINHTDAELILLENLVGRHPPFHGQGANTR